MGNEELADRIRAVTVTDAGMKMSVPPSARSQDCLTAPVKEGHRSGVDQFLNPWVMLDVGGGPLRINPNVEDKRIRRKVLRGAGGGSNLNALRPAVVREAMTGLMARIRSAHCEARAGADMSGFERKARKILRKREGQDRTDEQKRAFERVRKELLGPLHGISEGELVDLYRDCQVRMVMES